MTASGVFALLFFVSLVLAMINGRTVKKTWVEALLLISVLFLIGAILSLFLAIKIVLFILIVIVCCFLGIFH